VSRGCDAGCHFSEVGRDAAGGPIDIEIDREDGLVGRHCLPKCFKSSRDCALTLGHFVGFVFRFEVVSFAALLFLADFAAFFAFLATAVSSLRLPVSGYHPFKVRKRFDPRRERHRRERGHVRFKARVLIPFHLLESALSKIHSISVEPSSSSMVGSQCEAAGRAIAGLQCNHLN
jgi:hypothetical protein